MIKLTKFFLLNFFFIFFSSIFISYANDNSLVLEKINNLGGVNADVFYDILEDSSGKYVAVGVSYSDLSTFTGGDSNSGGYDFVIARLDKDLNVEKVTNFGSGLPDYFYDLIEDSNGNFIVSGNTKSDLSAFTGGTSNVGEYDFVIAKFDNDLNLEKINHFGSTEDDYFNNLIEDRDGNFIAVGYSEGDLSSFTGGTNNVGSSDFIVVKFDSDLNLEKINHFGSIYNNVFYSIVLNSDGKYVAAGSTVGDMSEFTGGSVAGVGYDFVIAEFDTDLNLEKLNNLGSSSSEALESIIQDNDGDYITVGYSYGNLSAFNGGTTNTGGKDFTIAKFDSALNLEKITNFGSSDGDVILSVIQDTEGKYIAIGPTEGDMSSFTGGSSNINKNDFVIIEFDEELNLEKLNNFGSTENDVFYSTIQDNEGAFIGVGYSKGDLSSFTGGRVSINFDFVIAKFQGKKMTKIAAGGFHSCYLLTDGAAKCWGRNKYKQLGDNTTFRRTTPVDVSGLIGADELELGKVHSCALIEDGTVKCWGRNNLGQLGDGTIINAGSAVDVSGLSNVTQLAAGYQHNCALIDDGTVKCWGWNKYGQIGDGTSVNRLTPVVVTGLSGVVELSAGRVHTCALLDDDTVKCWGRNNYGQLGDGTTVRSKTPITVSGLTNVISISLGGYHSCALMEDGTAKCWGRNNYGQLGLGYTSTMKKSPEDVVGLTNIDEINLGHVSSCVLKEDATVYCWGKNNYGQLADGSTINSSSASIVTGLDSVNQIEMGYQHTGVYTRDYTIEYWGFNKYGQIGDGTTVDRLVPTDVE